MHKTMPLRPIQVSAVLSTTFTVLKAELNALPGEVLGWHFNPKEWCIKQILGHLIETEKNGFAKRIPLIVKVKDPQLVSLDQDKEAVTRNDCEQDAKRLLKEFGLVREQSCTIVAALKDSDLVRGGWHPEAGYLTIEDLLHEWIYHDFDHVRQITDVIQRYIWDHLGKTQDWYKH